MKELKKNIRSKRPILKAILKWVGISVLALIAAKVNRCFFYPCAE